ncbi:hypothetical protein ACTU3I_16595 [Microbacterium sp. RD1]|uniref:hypothetical protein n=1 Tax=Microbacterium sp. RD1 TaxID=3457313 RepID=UPI003FA60E74
MPVDDWAYLAGRGGQPVEDLIATLLRRKYPDALQRGTAQGDKGIDIIRNTADGVVIWQVKKFVAALNASQWRQVEKSWRRFNRGLEADDVVAAYYLVTPWTPNENRLEDFAELTAAAAFPVQWDASAFLDGLAAEFPETYERFVYGPGALERQINAKAVLAASPLESAESLKYLAAVDVRQQALRALRDLTSDHYYIDVGTTTVSGDDVVPSPDSSSPAIYWRYAEIGEGRFEYEAIVPRTADSEALDPIRLGIQFHHEPGSPEAHQVEEWKRWGTPLTDIVATTTTLGGPHDGERHERANVSIAVQQMGSFPSFELLAFDSADNVLMRVPVDCLDLTMGPDTGWSRLVLATPARVLHAELRLADSLQDMRWELRIGDLSGQLPTQVRDEMDELSELESANTFAFVGGHGVHVTGTGYAVPREMFDWIEELASLLLRAEQHSNGSFTMPDIWKVQPEEVAALSSLLSVLDGAFREGSWETSRVEVPADVDTFIAQIAAGGPLVTEEKPEVAVGGLVYEFDHRVRITRATVTVDTDLLSLKLTPGSEVMLTTGKDESLQIEAVSGWERATR